MFWIHSFRVNEHETFLFGARLRDQVSLMLDIEIQKQSNYTKKKALMRSTAHMTPSTIIDPLNYIHSTYHHHVSLLDESIFLVFSQRRP